MTEAEKAREPAMGTKPVTGAFSLPYLRRQPSRPQPQYMVDGATAPPPVAQDMPKPIQRSSTTLLPIAPTLLATESLDKLNQAQQPTLNEQQKSFLLSNVHNARSNSIQYQSLYNK